MNATAKLWLTVYKSNEKQSVHILRQRAVRNDIQILCRSERNGSLYRMAKE